MLYNHCFLFSSYGNANGTPSGLWSDAVIAAGGTVSPTQLGLVDALVSSLQAAGVWANLDRLWLFASENIQQAGIDIVKCAPLAGFSATLPVFTAARGYTGNAAASVFIDTGFNPALGSANFTLNNASMAIWNVSAAGPTNATELSQDVSGHSYIMTLGGGAQFRYGVNTSGAAGNANFPNTGVQTGWLQAERFDANNIALWRNGASLNTAVRASRASFLSQTFKVFTGIAFSSSQIAAVTMGSSMAGLESAFYTPMRTYMTAQGVP